ncbi:hypothetical protein pb186bvf_013989 [Paramecium bursaria]
MISSSQHKIKGGLNKKQTSINVLFLYDSFFVYVTNNKYGFMVYGINIFRD